MEIEKVETVYGVQINTDLTEGRGQEYFVSFAEKKSTAQRLAHKRGVQGCDGRVVEVERLFISDAGIILVRFFMV